MKTNIIRANFNTDRNLWLLFKTVIARHKALGENGKERQATATDVLNEMVYEYVFDHKNEFDAILDDMRKLKIQGTVRSVLEEVKEEQEDE